MRNMMKYNPRLYNMSRLSQTYYRYFEVALGYWLTQGNTSYNNRDFVTYSLLLGGQVDPTSVVKRPSFQGKLLKLLFSVQGLSYHMSLLSYVGHERSTCVDKKKKTNCKLAYCFSGGVF